MESTRTTLEREKEIRGIIEDIKWWEIARNPIRVVESWGEVVDVIFSESLSGGADEVEEMPKFIWLTRLWIEDGELNTKVKTYKIIKS